METINSINILTLTCKVDLSALKKIDVAVVAKDGRGKIRIIEDEIFSARTLNNDPYNWFPLICVLGKISTNNPPLVIRKCRNVFLFFAIKQETPQKLRGLKLKIPPIFNI
ncbi:hypothetical protein [Segetibacter aerophilus]|uniref:hypothetical protein n=1 Tax=Segetibacter aerophilus TaxID=670293 RepID=UPI0011BD8087|nr:hypothetical protein [Segetibacter aerophilus]